jgi:hypothetical protein
MGWVSRLAPPGPCSRPAGVLERRRGAMFPRERAGEPKDCGKSKMIEPNQNRIAIGFAQIISSERAFFLHFSIADKWGLSV